MRKGVDESVDNLQKTLKKLGLDKNTIVIYCSDQGFYIGDHGWYDKRWMYDESLKMPFIVKWPGVTKPGSRNTDLIQNLDYAQTFLELAGAKIPEDMQGKSLVPLLKGTHPRIGEEYLLSLLRVPKRSHGAATQRNSTKRYKLMHFYQFENEWELYDLKNDPDELKNLYDDPKHAKLQKIMKAKLEKLRRHYEDESDVP